MRAGYKKYALSAVMLLLLVSALLIYGAKSNIEDFREQQVKLARYAAANTEITLQLYLSELRRSLNLFVNENHADMRALLDNTTRSAALSRLQQQLQRHLPEAISFTLADSAGYPLLDDNNHFIVEACRENMRLFASEPFGEGARMQIHADRFNGHFDILSKLPLSIDADAVVLVTVKAQSLSLLLHQLQPPDHLLFLVATASDGLIEVSAPEPRQRSGRGSSLTAAEISRMMSAEHVDATDWDVVDVVNFELLEKQKWRIIQQSVLILSAFLIGGVFSVAAIRCRADMKRNVSGELEAYRRQLEEKIRTRTAALEAANERLQHLSLSDGLTGIANRRHFDHVLARELRRALRDSMPLSLLLIDIDYFKRYNDAVGHLAGDDALKKIAHAIQNEFKRGADLAARYGGEEFAVILPGTKGQEALKQAERIRAIIDSLNIKHPDSAISDHITISVGVTSLETDQYKTTEEIIDESDTALYRSKSEGRNRSSLFQS